MIMIPPLDLIFILISSSCVHTGTSAPSDIVGCASAGVPQILLSVILRAHVTRFQMLHIVASEPINISIKHNACGKAAYFTSRDMFEALKAAQT